jgi:hypothetical protein
MKGKGGRSLQRSQKNQISFGNLNSQASTMPDKIQGADSKFSTQGPWFGAK